MDDVELWDLASHAPEPLRPHVVERLASDGAQRDRVEALLAQPAPARDDAQGPRYEIVGLIGAGTQADVYQARRLLVEPLDLRHVTPPLLRCPSCTNDSATVVPGQAAR